MIDNLSTGNLRNLDEVADRITLHTLDICDYDRLAPVIAGADRVFHSRLFRRCPNRLRIRNRATRAISKAPLMCFGPRLKVKPAVLFMPPRLRPTAIRTAAENRIDGAAS